MEADNQVLGFPIICLFCKENVLDNYLELHIRYEHKIGNDDAVQNLLDMHFPQTSAGETSAKDSNSKFKKSQVQQQPGGAWSSWNSIAPEFQPSTSSQSAAPPETNDIEILDEIISSPTKLFTEQEFPCQEVREDLPDLPSLGEVIFLSAFGIRFRCPYCNFVHDNKKQVKDHTASVHKAKVKKETKEVSPKKQEMRVKVKPHRRIYKDTIDQALTYYKAFGGLFFGTGIHCNVTYVREPQTKILDLKKVANLSTLERPCPKRFKRNLSVQIKTDPAEFEDISSNLGDLKNVVVKEENDIFERSVKFGHENQSYQRTWEIKEDDGLDLSPKKKRKRRRKTKDGTDIKLKNKSKNASKSNKPKYCKNQEKVPTEAKHPARVSPQKNTGKGKSHLLHTPSKNFMGPSENDGNLTSNRGKQTSQSYKKGKETQKKNQKPIESSQESAKQSNELETFFSQLPLSNSSASSSSSSVCNSSLNTLNPIKTTLLTNLVNLYSETACKLCDRRNFAVGQGPNTLLQHYALDHFREKLEADLGKDLQTTVCSLCKKRSLKCSFDSKEEILIHSASFHNKANKFLTEALDLKTATDSAAIESVLSEYEDILSKPEGGSKNFLDSEDGLLINLFGDPEKENSPSLDLNLENMQSGPENDNLLDCGLESNEENILSSQESLNSPASTVTRSSRRSTISSRRSTISTTSSKDDTNFVSNPETSSKMINFEGIRSRRKEKAQLVKKEKQQKTKIKENNTNKKKKQEKEQNEKEKRKKEKSEKEKSQKETKEKKEKINQGQNKKDKKDESAKKNGQNVTEKNNLEGEEKVWEERSDGSRRKQRDRVEIPVELQLPDGAGRGSRRGRAQRKDGEALQQLLVTLLAQLVKRDTNKWFSVPMNDKIAPGYSDKVKRPMDFGTMENKVDGLQYHTVAEFREDFLLICHNCQAFHEPDNNYHKAAGRMKEHGLQILSRENIRGIVIDRPIFSDITPIELGFDIKKIDEKEVVKVSEANDNVGNKSFEAALLDTEMYMSPAERVKFGRRGGQTSASPAENIKEHRPGKKRKRSLVENEIVGRPSKKANIGISSIEDDNAKKLSSSPQGGNDGHHDYFSFVSEKAQTTLDSNSKIQIEDAVRQKNVEKMRNLQREKFEETGGTYVQCCNKKCKKWRFLKEFEDPSLVPEYWDCSMNQDRTANQCRKKNSELNKSKEEDPAFVSSQFTCGSLVWARVKGFPWWPGLIDYCPDSEEFYWIEESESRTEPAWYHVVFLEGSGQQVTRSWVRSELIEKMVSPVKPPKNLTVKKTNKARFAKATKMATDCKKLSLQERLDKYSFASLYKGKWGDYSELSSEDDGDDENSKSHKKKKTRKTRKSIEKSHTGENQGTKKLSDPEKFECAKCKEEIIYSKFLVVKHLKKHRWSLMEYVEKYDPDDKNDEFSLIREWIDGAEFQQAIAKDPWKPNIVERIVSIEKVGPEKINPKESVQKSVRMNEEPEKFHTESLFQNKSCSVHFDQPILSREALIALAVRNLDPKNKTGAGFQQIVGFLSLHFPFYNVNYDHCRKLVKKAYGHDVNNEKEPKGNFRIKPAIVKKLYEEISPRLQNEKAEIEKSMLHPKFLDIMVNRFLEGDKFKHPKQTRSPPYTVKQLVLLGLFALKNPANIEQICVYLQFLFPGFASQKDYFRQKFISEICTEDLIAKVEQERETRYKILDEQYEETVRELRAFTAVRVNYEDLLASVVDESFINILFPGLEILEEAQDQFLDHDQGSENEVDVSMAKEEFLPFNVMVYFISLLKEKNNETQLTEQSIKQEIRKVFHKFSDHNLNFVSTVLRTNIFTETSQEGIFSIDPNIKPFANALMTKSIIENMDETIRNINNISSLRLVMPSFDRGAACLRSDFAQQVASFAQQKCSSWRPPLSESLIWSLAILSTVDINDTATHSSALAFIHDNFPWYRMTGQQFGLSIRGECPPDAAPDSKYSLSPVETAQARQQVRAAVVGPAGPTLLATVLRPEVFNVVLEPGEQLRSVDRKWVQPPTSDTTLVTIALLYIADQQGWASALLIQNFVQTNFPFYEAEQATGFLSRITGWADQEKTGLLEVEAGQAGSILPRLRISPANLLPAYCTAARFLSPAATREREYMRSPRLVRDILSLPPPAWSDYYSCPAPVPASALPRLLTLKRNIFSAPGLRTGSQQEEQQQVEMEADWAAPELRTHSKVALAVLLCDSWEWQQQDMAGIVTTASTDTHFSLLSLQRKFSLGDIVSLVREAFPFYESKENIKDFVVNDIQNNKEMISEYFELEKNAEGRLEYELKSAVLSSVFEEILVFTSGQNNARLAGCLRQPEQAVALTSLRPALSEFSLLALVLFLHGDPQDSYALCLDTALTVITDLGLAGLGLSGLPWQEQQLRAALNTVIHRLAATQDSDCRLDSTNQYPTVSLRTEEGRVDEIFANLQESVFNVTNKTECSPSLLPVLQRFMEMTTPPTQRELPAPAPLPPQPPQPPLPPILLLGLAMKNIAGGSGGPALMSDLWSYIANMFPHYESVPAWGRGELASLPGLLLEGEGDTLTLALQPGTNHQLYTQVAEFTKANLQEIQLCMRANL